MEDLLDLYMQPYDQASPVVCVDERPCQLIGHLHPPEPPKPGQVAREETEFARNGACTAFLMFEPQVGWRHVDFSHTRTKRDFASCLTYLLDECYPQAWKIRLVVDNLNTHTPAALYEAFDSAEALRLAKRIEWHYTPLHGSPAEYGGNRTRGLSQPMSQEASWYHRSFAYRGGGMGT